MQYGVLGLPNHVKPPLKCIRQKTQCADDDDAILMSVPTYVANLMNENNFIEIRIFNLCSYEIVFFVFFQELLTNVIIKLTCFENSELKKKI